MMIHPTCPKLKRIPGGTKAGFQPHSCQRERSCADNNTMGSWAWNEDYPKVREVFTITEKAPTRAFSWLKAPTCAFTYNTLLRPSPWLWKLHSSTINNGAPCLLLSLGGAEANVSPGCSAEQHDNGCHDCHAAHLYWQGTAGACFDLILFSVLCFALYV